MTGVMAARGRPRPARDRRRRRRVALPVLGTVVLTVLFLGVYPTRSWLAQRASLDRAEHQLEALQTENARLDQQVQRLDTDAEIERLAREQYNLVRPGEEAYALLPPPLPPIVVPPVWPFTEIAPRLVPPPG
ncbi:MAG: FtsB family cell division protein [Acidimicrobiia bacterium]